jgi:flagellar hook-length control protein FliK
MTPDLSLDVLRSLVAGGALPDSPADLPGDLVAGLEDALATGLPDGSPESFAAALAAWLEQHPADAPPGAERDAAVAGLTGALAAVTRTAEVPPADEQGDDTSATGDTQDSPAQPWHAAVYPAWPEETAVIAPPAGAPALPDPAQEGPGEGVKGMAADTSVAHRRAGFSSPAALLDALREVAGRIGAAGAQGAGAAVPVAVAGTATATGQASEEPTADPPPDLPSPPGLRRVVEALETALRPIAPEGGGRAGAAPAGLHAGGALGIVPAPASGPAQVQGQAQAPVASSLVPAGTQTLEPPVGAQGWDRALGERLVMAVRGELSQARMHLRPPHLGPLQLEVALSDDTAKVSFTTHSAVVREAIEAALPRLREMLSGAGLNLGDVQVSQQGHHGQGSGSRAQDGGQSGGGPPGARGGPLGDGASGGDAESEHLLEVRPGASVRGVDYYA